MKDQYYIYILTNFSNKVLYTGITNNLTRRIYEYKEKKGSTFTAKYNLNKLVSYEIYQDPLTAIAREKQIKAGSRKKKLELIESINPKWNDLSLDLSIILTQ